MNGRRTWSDTLQDKIDTIKKSNQAILAPNDPKKRGAIFLALSRWSGLPAAGFI